jgi:hypothetical protein
MNGDTPGSYRPMKPAKTGATTGSATGATEPGRDDPAAY